MYGMSIKKPDGSLWLSPDFTPVNLIDKGKISAKTGTVFNTSIPISRPCFFFVRLTSKSYIAFTQFNNGGKHAIKIEKSDNQGEVFVYAFSNMVTPPGSHGIAFYNANGEMVYHGKMKPLDAKLVSVSGITFDVNLGYPCAIMPSLTALNSVRNPSLGGFMIFESQAAAYGNGVYSLSRQVAQTSGPVGIYTASSVLVINSSHYD